MIEVDGSSHDHKASEDAERDRYLEGLGLTVIRLLAKDVLQNMAGVVAFLSEHSALACTPGGGRTTSSFGGATTTPPSGHPSGGGE